jgi:hypothetical protein
MLRLETESGWWLITHVDHARLAGEFAATWGNENFASPLPRARVLRGIRCHDDGWAARDASPQITREGRPSAFSTELVGKYSAFEEIDLADYLAVRGRAVRLMAEEDPYAALLISMHTYNLLTEHADRATMRAEQLPLLDGFLAEQRALQEQLRAMIACDEGLAEEEKSGARLRDHFRLLQAADILSLLSCVGYRQAATLLHPLPLRAGGHATVQVMPLAERRFRLDPYPFAAPRLTFALPARHVTGKTFASGDALREGFAAAAVDELTVTVEA